MAKGHWLEKVYPNLYQMARSGRFYGFEKSQEELAHALPRLEQLEAPEVLQGPERSFQDELAQWLMDEGYAEEERGYGHVTGETLAEALITRYEMKLREDS